MPPDPYHFWPSYPLFGNGTATALMCFWAIRTARSTFQPENPIFLSNLQQAASHMTGTRGPDRTAPILRRSIGSLRAGKRYLYWLSHTKTRFEGIKAAVPPFPLSLPLSLSLFLSFYEHLAYSIAGVFSSRQPGTDQRAAYPHSAEVDLTRTTR